MAKKQKSRKSPGMTIPMAVVFGTAPGVVAIAQNSGPITEKAKTAVQVYGGYDLWANKWTWDGFKRGGLPFLGGLMVHGLASKAGINRFLGRARIPFVRV